MSSRDTELFYASVPAGQLYLNQKWVGSVFADGEEALSAE